MNMRLLKLIRLFMKDTYDQYSVTKNEAESCLLTHKAVYDYLLEAGWKDDEAKRILEHVLDVTT
jgi:hypothetical protein